jgi:glycosyltransferase involved in cell wall biosynthesis
MQIQNGATFSIVVPLFNEEENIDPLVNEILRTVGSDPKFLEIVLVDDGSQDQTAARGIDRSRQDPRIRLIQHPQNKGLGGAIRTGLQAALGDFVLYTDADLPFEFHLIPELFALADEQSVITGCRLNRGEGARRWILTKGYNFIIRMLFGLSLKDVNFACKILPRPFLQQADLNANGSFIDVEMLLEARRMQLNIREFPMIYYPRERGLSTLSRPRVVLFILKEMFDYAGGLSFKEAKLFLKGWKVIRKSLNLKTSE